MSVFFILIPLTRIEAKKIFVPISSEPEGYVTFNDLNQLKIMFLLFAIGGMSSFIKIIWGFFKDKNLDINGRFKLMDASQKEISSKLDRLEIYLAQIKDAQVEENQVREIVRNEMEYAEKVQAKRRT